MTLSIPSPDAGTSIQLTMAIISFTCSCLTIWIIHLQHKWNGYLFLILNLSVSQAFYDISILLNPLCYNVNGETDSIAFPLLQFLRYTSGVSATLWTNFILFQIIYVVYYMKVIDARDYWWYLLLFVFGVSVTVALISIFISMLRLYYWIRIVLIVLNIIMYIFLQVRLHQIDREQNSANRMSWISYFCTTKSKQNQDPIKVLAYRLVYYPIVQILSRTAVAWYEQITNTSGFDYDYKPSSNTSTTIAYYLYSFTHPSAGIGYFIIFCCVSPGAWDQLKNFICCISKNNDDSYNNMKYDRSVSTGTNRSNIGIGYRSRIVSHNSENSETSIDRDSIVSFAYDHEIFGEPEALLNSIDYSQVGDDELMQAINLRLRNNQVS